MVLGKSILGRGKNNVQMEKHQEVTAQRRVRQGQREEDKITEAMQGRLALAFTMRVKGSNCKVWSGKLRDRTFVLEG